MPGQQSRVPSTAAFFCAPCPAPALPQRSWSAARSAPQGLLACRGDMAWLPDSCQPACMAVAGLMSKEVGSASTPGKPLAPQVMRVLSWWPGSWGMNLCLRWSHSHHGRLWGSCIPVDNRWRYGTPRELKAVWHAQAASPVRFQLVWQAASTHAAKRPSRKGFAAAVWQRAHFRQLPKHPLTSLGPMLAHTLGHLQSQDPEQPVTAVLWDSDRAGPAAPSAGLQGAAAGAVAALLRVAASEGAAGQRSVLSMGPADPHPGEQAAALAGQARGSLTAFGAKWGGGALCLPKLCPAPGSPASEAGSLLGPMQGRTAVVTGGMGALGRLVASWLGGQGLGVVLLGRTAHGVLPPGLHWAQAAAGDVACSTDMAGGQLRPAGLPTAGVLAMHAGGVLRNAMLGHQTAGSLREVLAPKVAGAEQLWRRLLGSRPHQALLFSSIAGLLGSGGQGSYAAANSALDALAASQQMQVLHWWLQARTATRTEGTCHGRPQTCLRIRRGCLALAAFSSTWSLPAHK